MSPRTSQPRTAPYPQAVPAVGRAMAGLEQLAASQAGLTLAELSRAIRVSPSSSLALLRTLERLGYVVHDPGARRYRVGPQLIALGGAARTSRLAEIAQTLQAAAEALSEVEMSADRRPIDGPGSAGVPPARGQDARAPRPPSADATWLPTGPLSFEEIGTFLRGPWLVTLACVKENGYPHTVPVWYEWDGSAFWVAAHARAEWAAHLRRDPRVSLTISEPEPPLRRVVVEGRAEVVESPGGHRVRQLQRRMAQRYLGAQAGPQLLAPLRLPRWLFRIAPEKTLTWRGLAPHPRYQEAGGRRQPAGAGRRKAVRGQPA